MSLDEQRGRIVDTLLQVYPGTVNAAVPVPREALREPESLGVKDSSELIGYMFQEVPEERRTLASDPASVIAEMDRLGIDCAMTLVAPEDELNTLTALQQYPGRFFAGIRANPHDGMRGVRRLEALTKEFDMIRTISLSPYGIYPFIATNAKEYYPIYAKAVELNLPVFINVGIPGPRVPGWMQDPIHLDEVCWFFPDLTVVMKHGGDPWADLCVKLMLKWPNLYYATSAFAPRHYPKAIIDYANTRGADKIMYAGYWPILSFERLFSELDNVPFRDAVWPKFMGENARRVFKIGSVAQAHQAS